MQYIVDGTVTPSQVSQGTATIGFVDHWSRRWRTCKTTVIPGRLTGNVPGCESQLIRQYFEYAGQVHYSFKKHIYVLGTGTGDWPDFYKFTCSWSHQTYACSTRVGDTFHWKPFG